MTAVTGGAVLVTGGASFLGQHLVQRLTMDGWTVTVLDHLPPPRWVADLGIAYRQADVCDGRAVATAAEGVDAVVHAAFAPPSRPAEEIVRVNVGGTDNVIAAALAAGGPRMVLLSSTIVQRPLAPHPFVRNAAVSRLDCYRKSRVAAEAAVARAGADGLAVAVARPKTFLGPGGVGGFAVIFELVGQGRPVPLLGPGSNRYQLIDVRDLAEGLSALVSSPATGYFEFGATRFGTVLEDLTALVDHAGTGAELRLVPPRLAQAALRAVELVGLSPFSEWHHLSARGEDSLVDTRPTCTQLGWEPTRSNAETLIDSYDWYRGEPSPGAAGSSRRVPPAHRLLAWMAGVTAGARRGTARRRADGGCAATRPSVEGRDVSALPVVVRPGPPGR